MPPLAAGDSLWRDGEARLKQVDSGSTARYYYPSLPRGTLPSSRRGDLREGKQSPTVGSVEGQPRLQPEGPQPEGGLRHGWSSLLARLRARANTRTAELRQGGRILHHGDGRSGKDADHRSGGPRYALLLFLLKTPEVVALRTRLARGVFSVLKRLK
jgi:hypothetical protein